MSSLPDLTPRQTEAAVERAHESLALTSGAGCGKTLVLARRFTELLLARKVPGESPFERFVALTFTDKAALEMIARVRRVLVEALAKSRSEEDRRVLAEWMAELPAARISTIHGFCAALLRRHAVEAEVDPDFAVLADELVGAQMRADAAEDAVLAAAGDSRPEVLELLAETDLWHVLGDVRTLMDRRIAWADEEGLSADQVLRRWGDARQVLRGQAVGALAEDGSVRRELEALSGQACGDPADKLLAYRREKLAAIGRILQDPARASAEDFAALEETPGGVGGHRAWGGREGLTAYRRRLAAFVKRFADLSPWFQPFGAMEDRAARRLAALVTIARDALARYDQAKRRSGLLDFDDLILLTARLLRTSPAVRLGLRRRLDQLLLDEGQDTDPYQLRMLWGLLADDETPPAGKLFVVGDLKQSIYRFRGVEADEFARLCRRFGKARIPLEDSFRVHKAGEAFVNRVFAPLMGADYEPIESARKERPEWPSVEILLADPGEDPDAHAASVAQADLLAERIARMVGRETLVFDRPRRRWRRVRYGDVAVLLARMTDSGEYERALRQRDIPYYVVAGTGFFRQQEVYDVLNALRAIDNPLDDVALVGVLRSAVFGLDDNVLLHLAFSAERPYFDRLTGPEVLKRLSRPQAEQLRFAHDLLAGLNRSKDALGPAGVIEALLERTGYPAVLLSEFQGRRRLGNVYRLLEAARSASASRGAMTLADFVRRYAELSVEESRYEEAAVVGEDDDVVRVMTIHKAKGLEFPVVILPDLNAARRGPRERLLFRRDWGLAYKDAGEPPGESLAGDDEDSGRGEGPPAGDSPIPFRLAFEAEKRDLDAEDVRKLYVAVTRHRDHLVFVGADWRTKEGTFRGAGCYLDRLDKVLEIAAHLDRGASEIAYGDGFVARLERLVPGEPRARRRRRPIGRRLLEGVGDGEALAAALSDGAVAMDLPRVGPLPGPADGAPAGAGTISATALADFAHCPMLYRWRHELRAPTRMGTGGEAPPSERGLDPATAGTILHRCLARADLARLLPAAQVGNAQVADAQVGNAQAGNAQVGNLCYRNAQVGNLCYRSLALVGCVLGEMDLALDPGPLAGELAEMLRVLSTHPLGREIRQARRVLPECAFVFRVRGVDVTGQMDLLYQAADGGWHVVDYKSDRIEAAEAAVRAERYETQMMIYLAAARRHLEGLASGAQAAGGQGTAADATVYFLRAGIAHRFGGSKDALDGLVERVEHLAGDLVRCRRSRRFPRRRDRRCPGCPYERLCLPAPGDGPRPGP